MTKVPAPAPVPAPDDFVRAPQRDVLGQHLAKLPRRTLAIALTLLPIIALVNIAVLVWSLGDINLAQRLVAPHLLALVALLAFVPMLTNSLRMALWSRFLGLGLGFVGALRVITGTMVANSVTPSSSGAIPVKVLLLMGEGIEARRGISLISFQAAEDALVMFCMVGLSIAISGFALLDFLASDPAFYAALDRSVHIIAMIAAMLVLTLALVCGLIAGGIFGRGVRDWSVRRLRQLRASVGMITGDWAALARRGKRVALLNLGLALVQWTVRFSIAGLVLAAFGTEWQPALFWLMQYLVQAISATVPSPGGAGGAEAGFLLLFAPFVDRAVLLPGMSAWRLLFFYLPLAGAAVIFFLLRRQYLRQAGATPLAAANHAAE